MRPVSMARNRLRRGKRLFCLGVAPPDVAAGELSQQAVGKLRRAP